ncbi:hypothetical protein [Streptomyces beihaiensis]|uniref:Uncharacterized protein n=1 Tax=Streptomyces beihaiensis TaxID=2984495 RepID=A0ABT3TP18_9ACTN|nr:hypothetical protein [Streptomyces beihaiensis]MCX3058779.1 hypothetical protein [Streptomyces beihaiensis]
MRRRITPAALAGSGVGAALLLGLAAPHAAAAPGPGAVPSPASAPVPVTAHARVAAHDAASTPEVRKTLSCFFARGRGGMPAAPATPAGPGAPASAASAAAPRIEGSRAVPVSYLSPDFVAGKKGAQVAQVEFLASEAVAADGRTASLWTVEEHGAWRVVNIASGDDEFRYARLGHDKMPGGTVFREPQINAWYVADHARVLPLDKEAVRAVGRHGVALAAYQKRVARAYGDKLPGSSYAKKGEAGGYGAAPGGARDPVAFASTVAGVGALVALGLSGAAVLRGRARRKA